MEDRKRIESAADGAPKGRSALFWSFNIVVLGITCAVMYALFPRMLQNVVFDGVLRNGLYTVPITALLLYVFVYYRRHSADINEGNLGKHRRPLALTVFMTVLTALWCMCVYASTDYFTYMLFASKAEQLDGLIPSAPGYTRFTPLDIACTDIGNSISTSGEHVDCKYAAPVIGENSFGYVAPIVPSGVLNVFAMKNPGFMLLDDSFKASGDTTQRLTRINDVQQVGPGMEWFDNLDYILAKTDFFANYDKPHYLPLDPAQPKKLTLVVPKIKYAYFYRSPYWGGVVLVHSDGKVEDLTAEQAMADPRLKGKWIYPVWLARHYVEVQNYAIGWGVLTPYVNVQGKLQVESLAGNNQFPFLTKGVDHNTYLVTAAKGQGTARGLQRMYFTDASTGKMSVHRFGQHEVVYGPSAAAARLTNIPGYQWHRSGEKGSGTIIAIEPVYVVRKNDKTLYWKFTITNIDHSGISATAVADSARPDSIKVFAQRADFESWMHGNEVVPASAGVREELLRDIESLVKQLGAIKARVEQLPLKQ